MTFELKHIKEDKFWLLIISREDGTVNDYRYSTETEAKKAMKQFGLI